MKAHPLFCDDETDLDRMSRDIGFINIHRFMGSKKVAFPNQWAPEQLQTIEDVFNEVGAGDFELTGRDFRTKQILCRQRITIEAPKDAAAPPHQPAQPTPAPAPVVAQPGVPMMQLGQIQIPAGVDPHVAMMMFNAQLNQMDKEQSRADARAHEASLVTMFTAFTNSQVGLVTGLVTGLAGGRAGGGGEGVTDAILKGIELANDLRAGANAQIQENAPKENWADTIRATAEAIKNVKDLASLGGSGAPVVPPTVPQ